MNDQIEYLEHLSNLDEMGGSEDQRRRRGLGILGGRGAVVALGLALVLAVSAATAYLTDARTADNVFTFGDVKIGLVADKNEPLSDKVHVSNADLQPSARLAREPEVQNTGKLPAYVFMTVSIPRADIKGDAGVEEIFSLAGIEGWTELPDSSLPAGTHLYVYGSADAPTELLAGATASLYDTIVFDADAVRVPNSDVQIDLKAYAVQTNIIADDGSKAATTAADFWNLVKTQG